MYAKIRIFEYPFHLLLTINRYRYTEIQRGTRISINDHSIFYTISTRYSSPLYTLDLMKNLWSIGVCVHKIERFIAGGRRSTPIWPEITCWTASRWTIRNWSRISERFNWNPPRNRIRPTPPKQRKRDTWRVWPRENARVCTWST